MTIPEWLTLFTAQAAQLPGWQLVDGMLRRLDERERWACPLMAQWNFEHPGPDTRCASSGEEALLRTWRPLLDESQVAQLMRAADCTGYDRLLRTPLLTACGVREDEDEERLYDRA